MLRCRAVGIILVKPFKGNSRNVLKNAVDIYQNRKICHAFLETIAWP